MADGNKIRVYKMTHATGFAPNPFGGVLTLACCKPQIRNKTREGDVIIGLGTEAMERNFQRYCNTINHHSRINVNNRIIYVMKVADVIPWASYYKWCHEKPERLCKCFESGTPVDVYGDCIYRWTRGVPSGLSLSDYVCSFEFVENPFHSKTDSVHDLNGLNVIIGDPEKSYFFGKKAIASHHIKDTRSFHRAAYGKLVDWNEKELFERLRREYKPVSEMTAGELEELIVPSCPEWKDVKQMEKDRAFLASEIKYEEIKDKLDIVQSVSRKQIIERDKPIIVISRKGFDTCYGRYPSLIIDKKMISFPIPEDSEQTFNYYDDCKVLLGETKLNFEELILKSSGKKEKKLFDNIILGDGEKHRCHLDPQLHDYYKDVPFCASLGQMGIPGKILQKYRIGHNDLFLFFGNFAFANGKTYQIDSEKMESYDGFFHCLWGYMEVDYVVKNPVPNDSRLPLYIQKHHPHCYYTSDGNYIYVASKSLSDCWCPDGFKGNVRGYGIFNFSDDLILSRRKAGKNWNRNQWSILPLNINLKKKTEIPKRGQEFVLYESSDMELLNDSMTEKFKDIIKQQVNINSDLLV